MGNMSPTTGREPRRERLSLRVSSEMLSDLTTMAAEESENRGVDLDVSWAARTLIADGLAARKEHTEQES